MIHSEKQNNCSTGCFDFGEMVGRSRVMNEILRVLPIIARSQSNVLILGELGTGKERIAKAIHCLGSRQHGPFVAANCRIIPKKMLDAELFGCKGNAGPTAGEDRQGRLAAAEAGSLFLDEVGDLPAALQNKLIRVIQQKDYESLGARDLRKANVRIMAGSSQELEAKISDGSFRKDLFYRLNAITITLPPLRRRREDIPLLVGHFIEKFNASRDKVVRGITGSALNLLMQYHYPGNIWELANIIEHAFMFCQDGVINPHHLPQLRLSCPPPLDLGDFAGWTKQSPIVPEHATSSSRRSLFSPQDIRPH